MIPEITPAEPPMSVDTEIPANMSNLRGRLLGMISGELSRIDTLTASVSNLESVIFDPEGVFIADLDPREVVRLYEVISSRRENTQKFILKVLEMATKVSLLQEMVNPAPPSIPSGILSDGLKKMKRMIQQSLDEAILDGKFGTQ